jgi:hypothetical protein
MSDLISELERECTEAGVAPTAVLKAANVHPSLWWKWRSGRVSPTLKSFEAVRGKLREMAANAHPDTKAA